MPSNGKLASSIETIKPLYDVVVIGSGYGGGISASRLSRMGKSVCVLERGREWETGTFPNRFPEMRAEMNIRGGKARAGRESALFDLRVGKDIHVLAGNGLGGGSLINAAVALRPDDWVFGDEAWPQALHGDDTLDTGFERARTILRPTADPKHKDMAKAKALDKCGEAFGTKAVPSPVVISFEDQTNPFGFDQAACTRCGDCCAGCNVGAKNTIAVTYLPDAKAHGAEIFTECKVSHIRASNDGEAGKWQIVYFPSDTKRKEISGALVQVAADTVVMAAGTLGTTEILLRSAQEGLPVSSRVGQNFSANGDIIAFGFDTDEEVNAVGVGHPSKLEGVEVGASVTVQLNLDNEEDRAKSIKIEEGALPSCVAPLLPMMFVPGGKVMGALASLIKGVYKGPLARTQTFFAVSHDDAAGKMVLVDDRLAIQWPDINDQPFIDNIDKTLAKATEAIGGSYVKNPMATGIMGNKPATAHPLGGCKMGETRDDGVVNHKCQMFDAGSDDKAAVLDGLYICDGSIIARSIGVNPLLTISALTERAMIHYARDGGLELEV